MGDISQKGLKVYDGRNLTVVWKSLRRVNTSAVCHRRVIFNGWNSREVCKSDKRVYQNGPQKKSHPGSKLFVKRDIVFKGEQPNHAMMRLLHGSRYGNWWVSKYSQRIVVSRMCGGTMQSAESYFTTYRMIGCIHVDRFLATVSNNDIYLRASVRTCTKDELMDYAARSTRGDSAPSYRYKTYSTRIEKGSRRWWPTLRQVWKKGRLISKRVTWPTIWKP